MPVELNKLCIQGSRDFATTPTKTIFKMSSPYFFFHPVLAADCSWTALDWHSGAPLASEGTDLVRCFSESAAAPLANLLPMVVSVDPASLGQDAFVDGFETQQVVFILPAASLENHETMARCKQLRARGYRFGVYLEGIDQLREVPVCLFDFLRFDATFARQELSGFDYIHIKKAGFRKVAANVATHEMFDWLFDKGFDWYNSRFLTARNPHFGNEPDLTRLKLLKLLNLVKSDGDTHQIEEIFREEPKLSHNLLRLVNSVAVGARTKISNFSQAIAILGRRQLQRWLQLLVYANNLSDGNAPNPLMQFAAARGRQMELLSEAIDPKPSIPDLGDNAFMTGLFSLLDILINLPMSEITKELPLQDEVVEALNSPANGGIFGQLLSAIIAGESGNFAAAEVILSRLGINPAAHAKSQVTALYWASRINIENQD
jgi:EAL and modified HD-GYP domain-containing signal transduction protein